MQIKILDKVFECDNQVTAVEGVFEQINQILANSDQHLSCLEIDGVKVYHDYDQYIVANLEDIKTIIVRIKTLKELIDDAIISMQDYLVRAVPEIEATVDEFYQGASQHTWSNFSQLLDGLQFIVDTLNVVSKHQDWYYNAEQLILVKQNLLRQIVMLQEAMESQDRVWLNDVLLYEIIPSFQALNKEIEGSFETGQVH
ncbi:hypothetical protein SCACP_31460 [Sporomusa carbonis]|uniref:hypothetical protein n=1 Tax=Sporomusa carbonis TaxID=3076075 RepID=UPI003A6D1BDE